MASPRLPLAFAMALLLPLAAAQAAEATKTVHSALVKASFTCPAGWIDKGTSATDFFDLDFKGAYNASGWGPAMDGEVVMAVNPAGPMTAEQIRKAFQACMATVDPSSAGMAITIQPITVNGVPGFDLSYGKGTAWGESRVILLFARGHRYTLSALAFDTRPGEFAQYAPVLDAVFKSFRLDP